MQLSVRIFLIALLSLPLAAGMARAQTTAITGGTVHTMTAKGTLENATVLIEGGRIAAVGTDIAIPAGATRIDAGGKVVTPGLIDSYNHLGLVEISLASESVDFYIEEEGPGPAFQAGLAVNPRSSLIAVNRIAGITRSITAPAPGIDILAGQGAHIHLGQSGDILVDDSVAMFASLGLSGAELAGGARGAAFVRFDEALDEAQFYARNRAAYDRGDYRPARYSRIDLDALVPVVRGQKPLAVVAERAADIRMVLAIAGKYPLDLVILGGSEGWLVADDLAAAGVPVVLNPAMNLPYAFDGLSARLDNAALLHEAGVTVAIGSSVGTGGPDESHNARLIRQLAGIAVSYGLPYEEALRAITANAAQIWGAEDYGTLAQGKDADVVVWSGDPFELSTTVEHVFIRGDSIPLVSRQTKLRDRYMNLSDETPPYVYR